MNKKDEQLSAAMSRSLWEFARLRLPWGDGEARAASQLLIDEGLRRAPTDDLMMSLWFIFYNALKVRYYGPGQLPTRMDRGSMVSTGWKGWGQSQTAEPGQSLARCGAGCCPDEDRIR